jgi:hypothetical protein
MVNNTPVYVLTPMFSLVLLAKITQYIDYPISYMAELCNSVVVVMIMPGSKRSVIITFRQVSTETPLFITD